MANPTISRLPAPHDCVRVSLTHWFRESWHVCYTGTPRQLVAAGIVDSDMERKLLTPKGGARFGKDGLPFKLESGRVPAHVQWSLDEIVTLKRRASRHNLLNLPGMAELFPGGINSIPTGDCDAPDLTHEQLATRFPAITVGMASAAFRVASIIGASDVRSASLRDRCVGRRQRPVQWLSIGKVIVPAWTGRGAA